MDSRSVKFDTPFFSLKKWSPFCLRASSSKLGFKLDKKWCTPTDPEGFGTLCGWKECKAKVLFHGVCIFFEEIEVRWLATGLNCVSIIFFKASKAKVYKQLVKLFL